MAEGMGVSSGRYIGEDGQVYNLVDLLGAGASPVDGLARNPDEYSPKSGRVIGEDGKVYNVVDLIAAKQAEINNSIGDAVDSLESQLALAEETIAGHTEDIAGVTSQLDRNAQNHMLANEFTGAYQGVDLTVRYADEIAEFGGDPWAWVNARVQAENFDGLHVHDYISVTCSNPGAYVLKMEIVGINTYKGSGSTEITSHIDWLSKDCWPDTVQYNPANYNNATGMDKLIGDGSRKVFQLTRRADGAYPALANVTVGSTTMTLGADYTYDAGTGVLAFAVAPGNAAVIKAVWATPILVPFLASNLNAFMNSLRMGVPNEAAADPLLTEVNYSGGGIYNFLPAELKAVIRPKRMLLARRNTAGSLLTNPPDFVWVDVGPLWVPDEMEVYGTYHYASNAYDRLWTRQYPGFMGGNRRKGAGNGGSRATWWLLPACSGNSTDFCNVYSTGLANNNAASNATRAPVGFRI